MKAHRLSGTMLGQNADRLPGITQGKRRSIADEISQQSRYARHSWTGVEADLLPQKQKRKSKR